MALEVFGDYDPKTKLIPVWTRIDVRKQGTSFGTFLSTLNLEVWHCRDCRQSKYSNSWHTQGFYERTAALYHHARRMQMKRLFWIEMLGGL